jgi:hypothetical protein
VRLFEQRVAMQGREPPKQADPSFTLATQLVSRVMQNPH